jgi:phospholipid/cholesterol/gamma-HCH transport system permease protein
VLPFLNILFVLTSLSSGLAVSFILYGIHPSTFLNSSISALSYLDFLKSSLKSIFFALILSVNSCTWGLTANGGSKAIGRFTTISSVMSLLLIFIFDFILTWILFGQDDSVLRFLWK